MGPRFRPHPLAVTLVSRVWRQPPVFLRAPALRCPDRQATAPRNLPPTSGDYTLSGPTGAPKRVPPATRERPGGWHRQEGLPMHPKPTDGLIGREAQEGLDDREPAVPADARTATTAEERRFVEGMERWRRELGLTHDAFADRIRVSRNL